MIKNLLAATALSLLSFGAIAADLPKRSAAVAPAPGFVAAPVWGGFYLGGQIGWQQLRNSYSSLGFGDEDGDDTLAKASKNSLIGGVHAGYDVKFGSTVVGLVADIDFGGSSLSWRHPEDWGYDQKIGVQGSLRARLGADLGRFLPYLTAGLAVADVSTVYCECPGREKFSDVKFGWTVGAGVEYAINHNWSARAEYRYSDFGKVTNIPTEVWEDYRDTHEVTTHTVRLGVSYRFGGSAAPVVARY